MENEMKKSLEYFLLGLSTFIGFVVLVFMITPGISIEFTPMPSYGFEPDVLYYSIYDLIMYHDTLKFGVFLAFVFALVSTIFFLYLLIVKLLDKDFYYENIACYISAGMLLVAGILFLFLKAIVGEATTEIINTGIGSRLCGILAISNAVIILIYYFRDYIFHF